MPGLKPFSVADGTLLMRVTTGHGLAGSSLPADEAPLTSPYRQRLDPRALYGFRSLRTRSLGHTIIRNWLPLVLPTSLYNSLNLPGTRGRVLITRYWRTPPRHHRLCSIALAVGLSLTRILVLAHWASDSSPVSRSAPRSNACFACGPAIPPRRLIMPILEDGCCGCSFSSSAPSSALMLRCQWRTRLTGPGERFNRV